MLSHLQSTEKILSKKKQTYVLHAVSSFISKIRSFRLEQKKNIIQVNKIEDVIGGGQVEELYRMAEDELKLIPKYAEWRMWETRDEHEAKEQSERV